MRWIMTAFLAVSLAGCELIENEGSKTDAGEVDECNEAAGLKNVAGTWKLTAEGSRTGCKREDLNVSFRIDAPEWSVQQSGGALSLALDGEIFATGTVTGSCVRFDTEESTSLGEVAIHWEGMVQDDGTIAGSLTVSGPGSCSAEGTFSVTVQAP